AFFCLLTVTNTVLGQKVDEKNVPADIRAVARVQHEGNAVGLWVLDKSRDRYVASVLEETHFRTVEISLAGKWLTTTDALQEKNGPAAVMKTVREKYLTEGFEASNYLFVRDSKGGDFYSVELTSDTSDVYLTLTEKGQLLREEEL